MNVTRQYAQEIPVAAKQRFPSSTVSGRDPQVKFTLLFQRGAAGGRILGCSDKSVSLVSSETSSPEELETPDRPLLGDCVWADDSGAVGGVVVVTVDCVSSLPCGAFADGRLLDGASSGGIATLTVRTVIPVGCFTEPEGLAAGCVAAFAVTCGTVSAGAVGTATSASGGLKSCGFGGSNSEMPEFKSR